MTNRHTIWSVEDVAARFEEAASTARRLPPVRVQGYFNSWPEVIRTQWEAFCAHENECRPFPPTPEDIERMLETMRWVLWLEVEQRHLVWMRAKRYGWREIAIRFACCTKTAQRHWAQVLELVASRLNATAAFDRQC